LVDTMRILKVPTRHYTVLAGWTAEKLGRLKPNGYLASRSPLSLLIEFEGLRLWVEGKIACWAVVRELAAHDTRLGVAELNKLLARASTKPSSSTSCTLTPPRS
jgi:hypothetical protein